MRVHCTVRQTLQFDILRFYILKEQYNEIFIIQTSVHEPLANRLKNSSPSYADSRWAVLKYCIFFFFCWTFHACHTVNNSPYNLKSLMLDSASSQLSREKKIIYLYNRPFYNCSCILVHLKKKVFALFKNRNVYSNYFMNGKWYFNGFELQSIM